MRKRLQFDTLGIAAATVVVAAVVAIGRQFFDAGALLACLLLPACLIFALGSRWTERRMVLGLISILAPLIGVVIGLAAQTLLWGAMLGITWIPVATIIFSTLIALLLLWDSRTRNSVAFLMVLVVVGTLGWLTYQMQATNGERWVASRFRATGGNESHEQPLGWVRIASKFDSPAGKRNDLRRVEGHGWRFVRQLRLLLGLSSAVSLQVEQSLQQDEWDMVSQLSHLKRLDLAGMVVDDKVLVALSELETLEQISFHDCEITASLAPLSDVSSLTGISFYEVSVNAFQGLEKLQSLEGIVIGHTPVDLSLAKAVVKLPQLKSLHVYGEPASDIQFGATMLRVLIDRKKQEPRWLHRCSVSLGDADVPTLVEYIRQFAVPGVPLLTGLPPERIRAVQAELDKRMG